MNNKVLYIGGFELPDKNAAAQRVIGISKGLRMLGYEVIFLNSVKKSSLSDIKKIKYYGFRCFEYKREANLDYLLLAHTAIKMINRIKPGAIIAYNYPAVALYRINRYCKKNNIRCFADVTEWYKAIGKNKVYCLIKNMDSSFRMRFVHKRMDGIITISRYLYEYYKRKNNIVMIPPTVDLSDSKWKKENKHNDIISFVYAGVPYVLKERLDYIVNAFERIKNDVRVNFNIIGITKEQFMELYSWKRRIPESVCFLGRLEHEKTIEIVKQADWAIILRDNNKVVKAGFPTKVVESISCGTPIICNRFSNITDYLDTNNSIIINKFSELSKAILQASHTSLVFNRQIFDYHNYLNDLKKLGF